MSIKLIIFDMDDVLCKYDLGARLRSLSRLSGQTPRDIRAAIWDSGFEDEADAGKIPVENYLHQFGTRLGYPISEDEWVEARKACMTAWPNMLAHAKRMGEKFKIALYTNNGPLTRKALPKIFPEAHALFGEKAFFSYQFNTKKPDPEAYRRLIAHLEVKPEEAWFIDDKLSNVEGARIAGLMAHHFRSEADFIEDARALNLLNAQ